MVDDTGTPFGFRCGFMDSYWISQAEPQTPRKIVQDVEPKACPQHVWKPPGWVWATWATCNILEHPPFTMIFPAMKCYKPIKPPFSSGVLAASHV